MTIASIVILSALIGGMSGACVVIMYDQHREKILKENYELYRKIQEATKK
jgi:hypothetical protein